MVSDGQLVGLHRVNDKLEDVFLNLYRQDLELYECVVHKKQLQQSRRTAAIWKENTRRGFFIIPFHIYRQKETIRQRRAHAYIESIEQALQPLDQRIDVLLDQARSLFHRIQERIDQMAVVEPFITNTISNMPHCPHYAKLRDLDFLIKRLFDHLLRYQRILLRGIQLRNGLFQYRLSMGGTDLERIQYLERSSSCFFHQLLFLDDTPIEIDELKKRSQDFRQLIETDRLILPLFYECSKKNNKTKKDKERLIRRWLKTYETLNQMLSHYWDTTLQTLRQIDELYPERHELILQSKTHHVSQNDEKKP